VALFSSDSGTTHAALLPLEVFPPTPHHARVFVGRGYALLVELVGAKDELQAQKVGAVAAAAAAADRKENTTQGQ